MKTDVSIPHSKTTDWNFSLTQTRPIILIDCMRKITTKIIVNRLENICRTRNLLKGLNHAGLKGNSTDTPIHILNGIIEDAKDTNRELWIVFQDMAKAFDSVDLTPLQKAMERLKIPEYTISYI